VKLANKKYEARMKRRMYNDEVKSFVGGIFNDKNRYEIVYVAGRRKRRLKLSEIEVLNIKYSYHIASVRFSYFESGKVKRIDFSQILRIIDILNLKVRSIKAWKAQRGLREYFAV